MTGKGHNIAVIDYGVGNHQSVVNALAFLGYDVELSGDPKTIKAARVLILPGVGAFGEAMKNIKARGLDQVLNEEVIKNKKPILGICLGMQILAEYSTELGRHQGLGWIEGHVDQLQLADKFRVPHVGWNTLEIDHRQPLFDKAYEKTSFYFDHSYHFICRDQYVLARCEYDRKIVAAIRKDYIFGVQFHPEKSQTSGLKLFRSFFNSLNVQPQGNYQHAT